MLIRLNGRAQFAKWVARVKPLYISNRLLLDTVGQKHSVRVLVLNWHQHCRQQADLHVSRQTKDYGNEILFV